MRKIITFFVFILTLSVPCVSRTSFNVRNVAHDSSFIKTGVSPAQAFDDVIFSDVNGRDVPLSSFKGKVIFINFWATWCLPCRYEMPSIDKLKRHFRDDNRIVFLMVDIDGDFPKSLNYMKKKKFDLPVYAPKSPIPDNFIGNAIPATVIINKEGRIAIRSEGAMDFSKPAMRKAIEQLVN